MQSECSTTSGPCWWRISRHRRRFWRQPWCLRSVVHITPTTKAWYMRVRISDGWCSDLVRAGMALGLRVKRLAAGLEGRGKYRTSTVVCAVGPPLFPTASMPISQGRREIASGTSRSSHASPSSDHRKRRPAAVFRGARKRPLQDIHATSARPPMAGKASLASEAEMLDLELHFKFLVFAKKAPHRERHSTRLVTWPHPPSN